MAGSYGQAINTHNHQNCSKGTHTLSCLPLLCVKCKLIKAPSTSQPAIQQTKLALSSLLSLDTHCLQSQSEELFTSPLHLQSLHFNEVLAAPFFCAGWFFTRFAPGPTHCWEITQETRSCSAHQTSSKHLEEHLPSTTASPNTTHAVVFKKYTPHTHQA